MPQEVFVTIYSIIHKRKKLEEKSLNVFQQENGQIVLYLCNGKYKENV